MRKTTRILVFLAAMAPSVSTAQSATSLQVWYSIRNAVPVHKAPYLNAPRVAVLARPGAVCLLRFRNEFAEVRYFVGMRPIEGYVEKFAISRRPLVNQPSVSLVDACYPPPPVALNRNTGRGADIPVNGEGEPDEETPPVDEERPPSRAVAKSRAAADSTDRNSVNSEFRKLALAQESYWAEKNTYTALISELARFFEPNPLLQVELLEATDAGWDARITVRQSALSCLFKSRVADQQAAAAPVCSASTPDGTMF
jgi:hypothetical protein